MVPLFLLFALLGVSAAAPLADPDPGCCGYINRAIEYQVVLNTTSYFDNRDASIKAVFAWWRSIESSGFTASKEDTVLSVVRYDYYDDSEHNFVEHDYRVKARTYYSGLMEDRTCTEFKYKNRVPYLCEEAKIKIAKEHRDKARSYHKIEQDMWSCTNSYSTATKICGDSVPFGVTFSTIGDFEKYYPDADEVWSSASKDTPIAIYKTEWRYQLELFGNKLGDEDVLFTFHLLYKTREDLDAGVHPYSGEMTFKLDSKEGGRGMTYDKENLKDAMKLLNYIQDYGETKGFMVPCVCGA